MLANPGGDRAGTAYVTHEAEVTGGNRIMATAGNRSHAAAGKRSRAAAGTAARQAVAGPG